MKIKLEKVDVEPAFFAVFGKGDAASDGFIIAFHVQVMTNVRVIFALIGISLTA